MDALREIWDSSRKLEGFISAQSDRSGSISFMSRGEPDEAFVILDEA